MHISQQTQRRFVLGRQGLWPAPRWQGLHGAAEALQYIESVQIDPVTILTQSHNLVMWSRVVDFQPEFLTSLLYEKRQFFDHGGALFIYPMRELPYWRTEMERQRLSKRWSTFAAENGPLIEQVRAYVTENGPTRTRDLKGSKVEHYRSSKASGVALYYLWLTGTLLTSSRHGKERVYDLLERVAPAKFQVIAPQAEADRYLMQKAIANLGLATTRRLRDRMLLQQLLDDSVVVTISVEGVKRPYYMLARDMDLLTTVANDKIPEAWHPLSGLSAPQITFLSPLDYVSARRRAAKLFDFDYIWEIYKTTIKRKYGPYTMPILYGDNLVGRIDASMDRQSSTLKVNGLWFEAWFQKTKPFNRAFEERLAKLARFLGAERVDFQR